MRTRSVVVGGGVGKSSHDSHMAPATTETKKVWMIKNGVKRQIFPHEIKKYLKDEWTFWSKPRVK